MFCLYYFNVLPLKLEYYNTRVNFLSKLKKNGNSCLKTCFLLFGQRELASSHGNHGIIANLSGDVRADIWEYFVSNLQALQLIQLLLNDNIMPFMYVCIILTCCVSSLFSFFLEDTYIPWTWYFRCFSCSLWTHWLCHCLHFLFIFFVWLWVENKVYIYSFPIYGNFPEHSSQRYRAIGKITSMYILYIYIPSCRHPTSPQRASTFPEETQNSLYATVHVMPLRIYVNSVNSTTTTTTTTTRVKWVAEDTNWVHLVEGFRSLYGVSNMELLQNCPHDIGYAHFTYWSTRKHISWRHFDAQSFIWHGGNW